MLFLAFMLERWFSESFFTWALGASYVISLCSLSEHEIDFLKGGTCSLIREWLKKGREDGEECGGEGVWAEAEVT